jgi:hypothetical protein
MASRLRKEFQRYTNPMPGDDILSAPLPPISACATGPSPYCRSNQPLVHFFFCWCKPRV